MAKSTQKESQAHDRNALFPLDDAVQLVIDSATAKFKKYPESVDVAINLGINARKSDQNVRGSVVMPSGTGKTVKIAIFADGEAASKAEAAGADHVGMDDLAEELLKGEINYDVYIATPSSMRIVGKLGKILGPRGLMPNPKTGTVTDDVETAVQNAKAGQVNFRNDKAGIIHCPIGKVSFTPEDLKTNLRALLSALQKAKPPSAKGQYINQVTLSSTMGRGVRIERSSLPV